MNLKNNYKRILSTLLLVIFVATSILSIVPESTHAAINKVINYQGKLTNASNIAVADGTYAIEFKLYTQLSGGVAIWTETLTGANEVLVSNGLFSVMLGSTTPFTGVDFNQTLYLGVNVESDGEMAPRKMIGAVPAAFVADTVDGISSEQFLRADASNSTSTASTFLTFVQTGAGKIAEFFGQASASVLSLLSNGNVGIGTTTPYAKLSVAGQIVGEYFTATSTATSTFAGGLQTNLLNITSTTASSTFGNGVNLSAGCFAINGTCVGAGAGTVGAGTAGQYPYYAGAGTTLTATSTIFLATNGKVGIGGIVNPSYNLDVLGTARVNANVTGDVFTVRGSNTSTSLDTNRTLILENSNTSANTPVGITFRHSNDDPITLTAAVVDASFSNASAGSEAGWLRFSTRGGGSVLERMRIDSNGNVGIGTTSPYAKLSVTGQIVGEYFTATSTTATSTFSGGLLAGGSTGLNVLQNGNVGIGTTSPRAKLSINGNINLSQSGVTSMLSLSTGHTGASQGGYIIGVCGTCTDGGDFIEGAGAGSLGLSGFNGINFTADGYDNHMAIASGGNVGIGSTTPGTKLSIGNTGNNTINLSHTSTSTFGSGINLRTGCFAVNGTCIGGGAGSGTVNSGTTGQLAYYAADGTAVTGTSTLFIAPSGAIGVGTTSTSMALTVQSNNLGGIKVLPTNGDPTKYLSISNDSSYGLISSVGLTEGVNINGILFKQSAQNGGYFALVDALGSDLLIGRNDDLQTFNIANGNIVVQQAGNVGIGTSTPYAKLSVVGEVVASHYTATTTATSTFAGGINVTSGCYALNGACTGFINTGGAGTFPYYAAGGKTLTSTSTIRLSSTGNVAIGTLDTVEKLTVGGNILLMNAEGNQTRGLSVSTYSTAIDGPNLSLSAGDGGGSPDDPYNGGSVYLFGGLKTNTGNDGNVILAHTGSEVRGNVGVGTTSPYAKLSVVGQVVASYFTATSTASSTLPRLATTGISADWVCLTGDCRTSWPSGSGSPYPFTPTTNYAVTNQATTGIAWFQNGLNASSTSHFAYASTTAISVNGSLLSSPASDSFFAGSRAGEGVTGGTATNLIGAQAGSGATNVYNSNFLGFQSGLGATSVQYSNFLGYQSGALAAFASYANFFGPGAGYSATNATSSNFFGQNAGYGATNASYSNIFGSQAGLYAINSSYANFLGESAGWFATNASSSNFIGKRAGYQATNASSSNFFGYNAGKGATNANRSIFIGNNAGLSDTVDNAGVGKSSILIGDYTSTGGFSGSVAIGQGTQNSAVQQLNLGNVLFATGIYNGTTASDLPTAGGMVGIGTSSPYAKLSVAGDVVADGYLRTSYIISTSTATSTFGGSLAVTEVATSSFAGGINLTSGCFAINNTCVGGGGTVTSVSNADGSLTISPTTGGVVASVNQGNSFIWTGQNTFVSAQFDDSVVGIQNTDSDPGAIGLLLQSPSDTGDNTPLVVFGNNGSTKLFEVVDNGIISTAGLFPTVDSGWSIGLTNLRYANIFGDTVTGGKIVADDETLSSTFAGKLGIGTTSPYAKLSVVGEVVASHYTATTTASSTLPRLATTGISADWVCLTGDCRTSWPSGSGSPYPFTPTTNYAVTNQATTGIAWFQNGLNASSTSHFEYASTTAISLNGYMLASPVVNSLFGGPSAGSGATSANNSNFFGSSAGFGATNANSSNFFGNSAGREATDAVSSNFLGVFAGYLAAGATKSNFIGYSAGYNAINAHHSNFIGEDAGLLTTNASFSNFLGYNAGSGATNASSSNFIGNGAGFGATNANRSIFIGNNAGLSDTVDNLTAGKSSILIGDYTSTGGFSGSVAIGQGTKNSAVQQLNLGNVLFATGIYNGTTASDLPTAGGMVGIGTSSPYAKLSVAGTVVGQNFVATSSASENIFAGTLAVGKAAVTSGATLDVKGGFRIERSDSALTKVEYNNAADVFAIQNGTAFRVESGSDQFALYAAGGNVGIGSSSPSAKLSVWGNGAFSGTVLASTFTATSTTATSTFGNGINIANGCFSINNVCVGGGVGSYSNSDANAYIHASSTIPKTYTANSFTGINTFASNVGVGTSSPYAMLSVSGAPTFTGDLLSVASSSNTNLFKINHQGVATFNPQDSGGSDDLSISGFSGLGPVLSTTGNGIYFGNTLFMGGSDVKFGSNSGAAILGGEDGIQFENHAGVRWATIDTAGNFGIGTTSPYAKLSVVGEAVARNFTATSTTATSTFAGGLLAGNNGALVVNQTAAANTLTVLANGNVGVGTASPTQKLQVAGRALVTELDVDGGAGHVGEFRADGNSVRYGALTDSLDASIFSWSSVGIAIDTNANTTDASFSIYKDNFLRGSGIELFRVQENGNIGIGTSTPYAKLSVVGEVVASHYTATTTATSTFGGSIAVTEVATSSFAGGINVTSGCFAVNNVCVGGSSGGVSGSGTAGSMAYWTDTGTIGATTTPTVSAITATSPTATSTFAGAVKIGSGNLLPAAPFQIGGTLDSYLQANIQNLSSGTSASSDWIATNNLGTDSTYYVDLGINSSNYSNSSYTITGPNDAYLYAQSNALSIGTATSSPLGVIKFHTGGTLAENERMRIDVNGNIGIGTTSPYAKLSVSGMVVGQGFHATSTTATSTFAGGLIGTGLSIFDNVEFGALSFDTDAGSVSWIDLPVSASAGAGTVEGFTAQLDSNSIFSIYGQSDGLGGIQKVRSVFGTSTSAVLTSTNIPYGSVLISDGALCVDNGAGNTCASSARTRGGIYAETSSVSGLDLAEIYPTTDPTLGAGDLLMLDTQNAEFVSRYSATASSSPELFGVVSTKPGLILGGFTDDASLLGTRVAIALAGRVPVKISLEGGSIVIGDRIAPSSIAGFAKKADQNSEFVIGTALENFNSQSTSTLISVFVDVQRTDAGQFNSIKSRIALLEAFASSTPATQGTTTASSNGGSTQTGVTLTPEEIIAISSNVATAIASSSIASSTLAFLNASSTLEILASTTATSLATSTSFIASVATTVKDMLQSMGEWVLEKITAKVAIFERVETQVAAISKGLEMTDQVTGDLYCVVIKNGVFENIPGSCADVATSTPEVVEDEPIVIPVYQPEDETGTSTPPVEDETGTSTPPTNDEGSGEETETPTEEQNPPVEEETPAPEETTPEVEEESPEEAPEETTPEPESAPEESSSPEPSPEAGE